MMRHETILIVALAFAGWIFWRLWQRRAAMDSKPAAAVAPGGIRLGQFSVAPDRRWLLLKPGT